MGEIVAGYASSHAFTFIEPDGWEEFRNKNRENYERRHGRVATCPPGEYDESFEAAAARYARIQGGLQRLRNNIRRDRLDCLIVIGDDQNENFDGSALPQIAIYTGADFILSERFSSVSRHWASASSLSQDVYEQTVKSGFDVTGVVEFREKTLRSHAHGEILAHILGDHAIPVVLMFLNAIHMPSLSPKRCFALGCAIADAVRLCRPADERVGVYASGAVALHGRIPMGCLRWTVRSRLD